MMVEAGEVVGHLRLVEKVSVISRKDGSNIWLSFQLPYSYLQYVMQYRRGRLHLCEPISGIILDVGEVRRIGFLQAGPLVRMMYSDDDWWLEILEFQEVTAESSNS